MKKSHFYPVILAGGRGTRFWPLSRKKRAKQMLPLDGSQSMIQNTVARLLPSAPENNFWIITNDDLRAGIVKLLPEIPKKQIIAEPAGRNTAPAIGLAAFILLHHDPDAVLGLFPSDHVITKEKALRSELAKAVQIAAAGDNIVVMGIPPAGPETGYGYIEAGAAAESGVLKVRRFREKPNLETAQEFVAAGNYFWNSGMFIWRAGTLADSIREYLPDTARILRQIAETYGTHEFDTTLNRLYPKCDNISVDYALLEPRSARGERNANIFCLPSDFGWNDLGSWSALYEHRLRAGDAASDGNVVNAPDAFTLNASGNYLHVPSKFVAAVGVSNLVVVETEDALLITTRDHSQDVGKVVKHLDEKGLHKLV